MWRSSCEEREMNVERLKEIIQLADKLKWIQPKRCGESYPSMQLSEIEKCMIALYDDKQLERLRNWVNEESQSFSSVGGKN